MVLVSALSVGVPVDAHAATKPCNGHVELCRRRYDAVAFPGTHNAMRSVAAGFASPDQERSIADQLDGGVRVLLLDVFAGTPTADRVCTDPTPLTLEKIRRELGRATADQLIAARDAQCPPAGGPTSSLYLCHSFCELGATKLDDALAELRDFLRQNPGDVVTLVLEDYAPIGDIAAAFRAAGLSSSMVDHDVRRRWPTLGALRRDRTRLVVFAQHQGGQVPGVLDAFAHMGETPYRFGAVEEMTCAPNRGPVDARLFLLNHWIEGPDKRAAATDVNAADVLGARADRCAAERDHIPNFVVVNFAEEGDLLAVVDDLNRVQQR